MPSARAPKTLVVCCDGTWNRPNQAGGPTNVAKVALSIADRDDEGRDQIVYYHEGVGTKRYERIRGGVAGFGLSRAVKECYAFIAQGYEPGDRIYLFGFSRGAYTARSLAGLIRNCWVLRPDHLDRIGDAYRLYRDREKDPHSLEADLFRRTWAREADVFFIGVWDTVGSLGLPGFYVPVFSDRWRFHDVHLSQTVRHAYQALAADERRRPFTPSLWIRNPEPTLGRPQTLEQVWFSGAHSDVGGGYPDSDLSEIPLCWMVQKAVNSGLAFRSGWLTSLGPERAGRTRRPGEIPFSVSRHFRELAADALAREFWTPFPLPQRDEEGERRARAVEVNPDPGGRCHDSFSLLYRTLGPKPRSIPFIGRDGLAHRLSDADIERLSNQSVASSVAQHLRAHVGGHHVDNLRPPPTDGPLPTTPVPTVANVPVGHPVVRPRAPESTQALVSSRSAWLLVRTEEHEPGGPRR